MPRPRRAFVWASVLLVGALMVWHPWSVRYTTNRMTMTWKASATPLLIRGHITDELGVPIKGQTVTVHTDSGASDGITDANGDFRIEVGEVSITEIELNGIGSAIWRGWNPLDVSKGINFTICIHRM